MRHGLLPVLLVLVAGCVNPTDAPASSPTPSDGPHLEPRQLLSKEGNPSPCAEVLRGESAFDFTVSEGYDRVEVVFHASGLGQIGWTITGPDGASVANAADWNPQNEPCRHAHGSEDGTTHPSKPGAHRAVVRHTGIVSWHLIVNEKSSDVDGHDGHQA